MTGVRVTTRRVSAGLSAVAVMVGTAVVAVSMATTASAAGTPAAGAGHTPKSGHHAVRQVCPAAKSKRFARCFAIARTDVKAQPKGVHRNDTPAGYGPSDLQSAYNLPSGSGNGEVVGIVDAYDDPTVEADLAVYRAQYGLPACTTDNGCFQKVNQEGEAGDYPDPDPGWAGEISLDVDMVSAACPNCHILLVEGDDNSFDSLAESVDTAVSLGAKFVSNSYGGPEDPADLDYNSYYDHPGVVVTASTGDDGYGTSYPATSPGVTAVGGTSLVTASNDRGWSESAWDGAGSGCSSVQEKPAFQTDPDCDMRSEADVSADADPDTGVSIYNSYSDSGWDVYGGTSASSPLIASTYALGGTPAPGSDPESYPYDHTSNLYDVTSGSNGSCDGSYLCTAGPGYDGPTGLGTPDGAAAFSSGPHGIVKGVVTAQGGDPIADATVSVGESTTETGTDGSYTISVPKGTYPITAAAYGYRSTKVTGVVVANKATVKQNFLLTQKKVVSVTGVVSDASGHGWPLYSELTLDGVPGGPVFTDPFTGHYSLSLPVNSTYSMTVAPSYAGYSPQTVKIKVGSTPVVDNIGIEAASDCSAPGYKTKYAGTIEHFDGDTIPSDWTVRDYNKSGGVWVADDPGDRGNLTGGDGNFAIIDSDHLGADNTQDTGLISPSIDLSGQAHPEVGLNSDYKSFFNSTATIDYTIDSGKKWHQVYQATDTDQQGPLEFALPLAANQPNVKVRFHFTGSFAYYWEVDDVFIGTKTCATIPGGIVSGFVRDANTGAALDGATVSRKGAPTESGVSAATPDDPTIPDGLYHLFSTQTGKQAFVATKSKYSNRTNYADVSANYVTRRDFNVGAGRLSVSSETVKGSAVLGGKATASVKLKNTGSAPVSLTVAEKSGGFQIAGKSASATYAAVPGAQRHRVHGHFSPRWAAKAGHHDVASPASAARPADDPWQAIADVPDAISNSAVSNYDGKVYTVAGFDGAGDVADAYSYDPSTTSWTQLASLSDTREAPTSGWIDGKLYVVGGWDATGTPIGRTEVYDPDADSWSTVADNPDPYAASSATVLDGKLYVVGGCTASGCGTTDVEVYDPSSDSWSAGTPFPQEVSWTACGAITGEIYCAGGTNDSATSAATYAYDGSTWTQLADMPTDDWGAASSVANGLLLVSGGVIQDNGAITNEGWSYDPTTDAWTALPNSDNTVYRTGGACGFYKIGGQVDSFDATASSELLPGYDQCSTSGTNVPWLSESPTAATLAPGQSVTLSVRMNSASLDQPGRYTAGLSFQTDTPYQVDPLNVVFQVTPPSSWGKITGVVSGKPCGASAGALAGVTVQVNTWAATYTLTTDADGRYALWLDKRNNPLTLIVAKDGWQPQTKTVKVSPSAPTTANFNLKPSKAC